MVPVVARHPEVREVMRERQRELAELGDAVIEGRDIGTVVCPNADVKVYLVADRSVREERRQAERPDIGADALATDLRARDDSDRARMQPAEDAEVIDTSDLDVEDVVDRIEALVRARLARMNSVDAVWAVGRLTIEPLTKLFAPLRNYGAERIPLEGGVVLAMNHFSWLDPPAFGTCLPADDPLPGQERDPQPLRARPADPRVRRPLRAPRRVRPRGGSRDARDRPRRQRARPLRRGHAAEERHARARRCPARRWSRSRRTSRSCRRRSTGASSGSSGNLHPVSIAWGEPMRSRASPAPGKGYREGSALIQEEIHRLWRWLGGLHEHGRPDDRHATAVSAEELLGTVAVVGFPNVGKSTLVNRLTGSRQAVVHETPGVTRDRKEVVCEWAGQRFLLVDTGGVDIADPSPLTQQVAEQARRAIAEADLVLFVVDTRTGITPGDEELAAILRRSRKPIFLIANKIDEPGTRGRGVRVPPARPRRPDPDLVGARPRHRRPARRDRRAPSRAAARPRRARRRSASRSSAGRTSASRAS